MNSNIPELKLGDIFMTDSDRIGPKIVKFLMTAPTLWHYIWRAIRGTQQEVRMYHVGMVISQDKIVEQQSELKYGDTNKILDRKHVIWRYKHLTEEQAEILYEYAKYDLGKKYDVVLILGKTLTWLTGIKWFSRNIQINELDICVTRVAGWYFKGEIYTWDSKTWHELTTDIIDDYNANHLEDWLLVSKRD